MNNKANISAEATLTVRVTNLGSWASACTVDQVFDQGSKAAIGKLKATLEGTNIEIIGEPRVTAVAAQQAKS